MFKRLLGGLIEKSVKEEILKQNKNKINPDIYRNIPLDDIDRGEFLARSIQRTGKDLKAIMPDGTMDASCGSAGSLKDIYGISNVVDDIIYTHFAQQGFIGYQASKLDY